MNGSSVCVASGRRAPCDGPFHITLYGQPLATGCPGCCSHHLCQKNHPASFTSRLESPPSPNIVPCHVTIRPTAENAPKMPRKCPEMAPKWPRNGPEIALKMALKIGKNLCIVSHVQKCPTVSQSPSKNRKESQRIPQSVTENPPESQESPESSPINHPENRNRKKSWKLAGNVVRISKHPKASQSIPNSVQ